jgi:hypothetical protein
VCPKPLPRSNLLQTELPRSPPLISLLSDSISGRKHLCTFLQAKQAM